MQANLPWGSRKTTADFTNYRYILDIDGNGWSARTQQLFSAGSVVIKNSLFKEWWNDRIQPWKHYVPVTLDFSDIYEVLHYVSRTRAFRLADGADINSISSRDRMGILRSLKRSLKTASNGSRRTGARKIWWLTRKSLRLIVLSATNERPYGQLTPLPRMGSPSYRRPRLRFIPHQ